MVAPLPYEPGEPLDLPVAPPRPPRRRDPVAIQAVAIVLLLLAGVVKVFATASGPAEITLQPALVGAASHAAHAQRTARAEFTVVADGVQIEHGDFQLDFPHSIATAELDFDGARHVAFVTRGDDTWVRVPDDRRSLNAGKRWAAVRDDASSDVGVTPGVTSDPTELLDRLAVGGAVPVRTGRADVRGVPTVKFHLDVRVADAIAGMPDDMRLRAYGAFADAGVDTLHYDVWIDRAGLPRRLRSDIRSAGSTVSVVLELFDYGRALDVTIPAAADSRTVPTLKDAFRLAGLGPSGLGG